jgi:hypothetical protein
MSKLVIPRLSPKSDIKFCLTGEVFEENPISSTFVIKVPPACPLINKTAIQLKVTSAPPIYTANGSKEFKFGGYKKFTYTKSGFYKFRIRLTTVKDRGSLKAGDTARIFVDGTTGLSALNANVFTIISSGPSPTGDAYVVDFEIPNSFVITSTYGFANPNAYVREVTVKNERKTFQISLQKQEVFDQLIDIKNPATGTPRLVVKDMPIYAFKNYDKENSAKLPKKLLLNFDEINEETPPAYTIAMRDAYLAGTSYSKMLRSDENPNFIFYVAIARYKFANNKWTGEWLQKNSDNKAIWGKAILSGK